MKQTNLLGWALLTACIIISGCLLFVLPDYNTGNWQLVRATLATCLPTLWFTGLAMVLTSTLCMQICAHLTRLSQTQPYPSATIVDIAA